MSTLRSAIEELRGDDLDGVDDDVLEADLDEVIRASDLLHAEALRRIAEIERRGIFARDGHLSMTAWLVSRSRLAWSASQDAVRTARVLGSMPHVRTAFATGEIGRAAVATLVRASAAHPNEFARSEELLVDAARSLGVAELRHAVDHWRAAVDHRSAERADEERLRRRNLHVSPTFDGMVRVDGDLDPENGQALLTALQAIGDIGVKGGRGDDQ
jgi:hypothetical protein